MALLFFFWQVCFFSHALLALHFGPGEWCQGHSAVRRDLVCSFFSLSHFFRSSFWWRGSASFVNTLPAVVSTRWFPFVAFVCGCSQNMCMSSDVSVTKRQLVSQRRKKLLTGGRVGGRRVLVSARTGKEHPGRGGRQKAGTGRHARQPSSRNHTGNDKKKARY